MTAADRPARAGLPRPGRLRGVAGGEHGPRPGVYVKLAKKGAGVPSVTYAELVESCLCFGWIDGRSNRLDDRFYLQRMTPRRARSVWSQKNVDAVEALTLAGRMRPPGWPPSRRRAPTGAGSAPTRARPRSPCRTTSRRRWPPSPPARQEFEALDGANRYAVLWRVHTAASRRDPGEADRRPGADARRGPAHPLAGSPLSRGGRRTGSRAGRRWSPRPASRRCGRAPSCPSPM